MSVDAQYYVSKNLNDLRDKFAQFVKKYIDPNKQQVNDDGTVNENVIKAEDVCQFFEEMGQLRR